MKKSNVTLLVFSVTILFVSQVLAAEFHVSTRNQLKEALSMSAGNKDAKDTIYLAAGIYTGEYRLDGFRIIEGEENEIKVCGEDGTTAEQVIIDGEDTSNIIYIDSNNSNVNVIFQGLTIQRGGGDNSTGKAAFIRVGGNIEFIKCIIDHNCKKPTNGRVLNLYSKNITKIYQSTISNSAISDVTYSYWDNYEYININSNTVFIHENTFINNRGIAASINDAYSVTINSNQITNNEGGISCSNIKHLYISNNVVSNNYNGRGFFINHASNLKIINNIIKYNRSREYTYSKWTYSVGGGIYLNDTNECIISHNTFTSNIGQKGGALYINSASNLKIFNNFLNNNKAAIGGALYIINCNIFDIINNSYANNISSKEIWHTSNGGAIYIEANDTTSFNFYNNIFWNNTSVGSGNDIFIKNYANNAAIFNNIVSDLSGAYDQGGNNSDADPMFADPQNNDYHLSPNSPCINAGNNDAPNLPETDLDNLPRIVDNIVDIGAYEFTTTEKIPSDQNEDWKLSQEEFNAYAEAWRKGETWQKGPEPIPIDYVTRSGYLQKKAEKYKNEGGKKPTCWKPDDNNTKK